MLLKSKTMLMPVVLLSGMLRMVLDVRASSIIGPRLGQVVDISVNLTPAVPLTDLVGTAVTGDAVGSMVSEGAWVGSVPDQAGAVTIKMTAQQGIGAAAADVVEKCLLVDYFPAGA